MTSERLKTKIETNSTPSTTVRIAAPSHREDEFERLREVVKATFSSYKEVEIRDVE